MGFLVAWILALALQEEIDKLGSRNPEERDRACAALRARGPSVIPALEEARKSDDPEVAERARRLLHDLGATSALIEDLASDDIPGNARAARNALLRRYDRGPLLSAVRSGDFQQAAQCGFILCARGDAAAAASAAPDLLFRAVAAFVREEDEDFHWLVGHLILRLWEATKDEASLLRAVRGIRIPWLYWRLLELRNLSRELRLPLPEPLFRKYLRDRPTDIDLLRPLGNAAVPLLRDLADDGRREVRCEAGQRLLELGIEDLPVRVLVDLLPEQKGRVRERAAEALPWLEAELSGTRRLHAAEVLVELGRDHDEIVRPIALRALETDAGDRADIAARILVRLGTDVKPLLDSDDEQVTAWAAWILAEEGRLEEPSKEETERICRFAMQERWTADCTIPLLRKADWLPGPLETYARRLGRRGVSRWETLRSLETD